MSAFKFFLALGLLTASLTAGAAVQAPPDGVTFDHGRAPVRRGAETLHPVRIDRAWVEESMQLGGLYLPSTGKAPELARFARAMHSSDGNWTWVGKVDTDVGVQSVILTFGDHAVFGFIPQKSGFPLRIESRHGQSWLVEGALAEARLPVGQSDGLVPPIAAHAAASQPGSGTVHAAAGTPPRVDVLVAYTPSLVTYYGSDSAVRTRIDFLASLANQAYVDSQANIQVRIVDKELLDYTAATDNSTLLDLITNASSDPVKVNIDSWRAAAGADLVAVIRAYNHTSQTNCGLAWIGGYHGSPFSASYGFATLGDGTDSGFYCADPTFAHEIGHNMGAQHDDTTSGGDYGAYVYSRGYRQTIDSGTGFATIMAYPTSPQTRVNIFSNPRLNNCIGQPCGVVDFADNARGFSDAAASIAALVGNVVPVLPTLSINDVTISEGNSGTKTATFTVKLSATSASAVTYDIATSNGTAAAGSDYVSKSLVGESIAAGTLSKTFTVTINGDTSVEANENFKVTISNPSGATAADGSALATINNDDGPTLSIADVGVAEGNTGTKVATFTVKLSAASGSDVTYNITTADATATAGSDYVAKTLTGETIPAGSTTKTFTVTLNGDTAVEANETYTVTATSVVGATVVDNVAVGTLVNDDGPTLSIGDVSLTEGNSGTKTATFTISLSQTSGSAVTYNIATANGTATAGSDYVAKSLTGESIAAGLTSKTFAVTINGDTAVEPNETFTVTLSNASGASIFDAQAIGTIINDESNPTLTIGDVAVTEGNSGTKLATFTVSLSSTSASPVTYNITTNTNGTATSGVDYVANSLTGQTIPAGQTSKTFDVTINGDTTVEANETYTVGVSSVVGAVVGDGSALGTITNDDTASLSIGDVAVTEGNSGTKLATFTISLNKPSNAAVTYNITTNTNGTATSGVDYVANSLTGQTIAAGSTSKTFDVTINGDTTPEANETYTVGVSSVVGANVTDGSALGTITNDD